MLLSYVMWAAHHRERFLYKTVAIQSSCLFFVSDAIPRLFNSAADELLQSTAISEHI